MKKPKQAYPTRTKQFHFTFLLFAIILSCIRTHSTARQHPDSHESNRRVARAHASVYLLCHNHMQMNQYAYVHSYIHVPFLERARQSTME